jgi:hypothetical protein
MLMQLSDRTHSGSRLTAVSEGTMTKSPLRTLRLLHACLREQTVEIATLRDALDIQTKRIAQMQAERDLSSRRGESGAFGYYPVGKPN